MLKYNKVISIVLLLAMLFGFSTISASAATASPQYMYISDIVNDLEPNGGKSLYVEAGTYGYFNADKSGVTLTLQKQSGSSWSSYKVWSATSPSSHPDYVLYSATASVSSGNYRLVTSHSVTVDGDTEYEGMTSDVVTIS